MMVGAIRESALREVVFQGNDSCGHISEVFGIGKSSGRSWDDGMLSIAEERDYNAPELRGGGRVQFAA